MLSRFSFISCALLFLTPTTNAQTYDTEEVSMMRGVTKHIKNGWEVDPLFTVGETDNNGTDYSLDRFNYRVPGVLDGMYAFKRGNNQRRIDLIVNHELQDSRGYIYNLANGTQLTGARISSFRVVQKPNGNFEVQSVGLAYDTIYDRFYKEVTHQSQLDEGANPGSLDGMDRLCSANGIERHKFGFRDNLFFSGEETDNGQEFVLDVNDEKLYCVPAMGRAAWESVCVMENYGSNKVVVLIGDDRGGAPLLLYVGEKDASYVKGAPEVLVRNGLAKGNLYVWVADNGDLSPEDWNGTGTIRNGKFKKINHFSPSMAGSEGYDTAGWADLTTQDVLGTQIGRFNFSRPEDVHTNPADGTQAVLASTGRDSLFPSDAWGTTYLVDLNNVALAKSLELDLDQINELPARLTILYDGDDAGQGQFSDPDFGLRSPDNLTWSEDGYIYINEDRSVGGFCNTSGLEASVWQLNPYDGLMTRILEMDRNAVPFMQNDTNPTDCGNWESSGTIDVSRFFQTQTNQTLLLLNVQAHSNNDVNTPIGGNSDLAEGGQILFASRIVQPITNVYRETEENSDNSGVQEININEFIAYPNPAKSTLNLKSVSTIQIFDELGNLMIEAEDVKTIDVSQLKTGIYVLKTAKGEIQKIIIK